MMSAISHEASASLLSTEEQQKAVNFLTSTRDALEQAVAGLTESQWQFKPAEDRWSIAENLEHVVLIEGRVHAVIERMPEAPAAGPGQSDVSTEEFIVDEIPKRLTTLEAPGPVLPTHRWTPGEALELFLQGRAKTLELLKTAPALRGHLVPHPVLGPWDGYQWILAAGAHGARHTGQMLEVKADASFPD